MNLARHVVAQESVSVLNAMDAATSMTSDEVYASDVLIVTRRAILNVAVVVEKATDNLLSMK